MVGLQPVSEPSCDQWVLESLKNEMNMSFKRSGPNEIMKIRQNQTEISVQLVEFMISRSFFILPETLFPNRSTLMLRNN